MAAQELAQIVPKDLLNFIRDRIKAGVTDAEAKFHLNEQEEDAITGALGHAISTPAPVMLSNDTSRLTYEIKSYKIRGRGPGAPEKSLGADAIFHLAVFDAHGTRIFEKGLPFQAKKGGGYNNVDVQKQANDLYTTAGTGIIVRYSEDGYSAVDVRQLVASSDAATVAGKPVPKKLAAVFGDDFLDCKVGLIGLHLESATPGVGEKNTWAIATQIRRLRP